MVHFNKHIFARMSLTLLAVVCSLWTWAENITAEQALQQARAFVKNHKTATAGARRAPATTPEVTLAGQVSGLYVFNVEDDGGFVIVSNDDRAIPVLGYGDSGNLDLSDIPSNMRAWLQMYADEIAWMQTQLFYSTISFAPTTRAQKATVGPLISTTWNQSAPYNNQTPYYKETNGNIEYSKDYKSGYSHCATGCVATAMAQVMNYHKCPTAQTGTINGYTWNGISLDALASTTFDWNNMIDSYKNGYTTTQANAVSTLMKYCGWALQMNYGPESGSNSGKLETAFKIFGYNAKTVQIALRSLYTYDNWVTLIYHELESNRPVIISGQSVGGGHAFVCDGYKYDDTDDTERFHINWGWGGLSDNYFTLSALTPDLQGIGGSSNIADGFNSGVEAVIGIQSSESNGTVATVDERVLETDLMVNGMTIGHSSVNLGTPVNITLNITNTSDEDYKGDLYVGVYCNGSYSRLLQLDSDVFIPAGETIDCEFPYTPDALGTYKLLFYYPTGYGTCQTDRNTYGTFTVVPQGAPTDLTVSDIKGRSVMLDWTDNYGNNSWAVAYAAKGATSFTEVTARTNHYSLTSLSPRTEYTVKVRPANSTDLWGEEMTFITDVACPVPEELAVGKITHNSAEASWTGYADYYDVRYGIVPENSFSTVATWLQYDNGTRESCLGFGQEEYTWGVMYPGEQITGDLLTKVSIFESYGNNSEDITVNIYSGGDNAPGTLLYTQVVTTVAMNDFHEVELDEPVEITPGENLWITLTEAGTHTMTYCEIAEGNSPNSQWVMYDGRWYQARNLFSSHPENLCWMIRGYMESKGLNPDLVNWTTQTCNDLSCKLVGMEPATDYVVQVRGYYSDERDYSKWESQMFTTQNNINLGNDANNNSRILSQYADGQELSVTLADRTLFKDGSWNTICLPFNVVLDGSPLEGATAKTLYDATMTENHVELIFSGAVDELEAGVPYIIKWDRGTDITDPVFTNVTIASTEGQTIEMANGNVQFTGYYDAFDITANDADIYYMTANNTLKHTAKTRTLKACRAYFRFTEAAAERSFVLDFGDMTTEIALEAEVSERNDAQAAWYTVDGVKQGKLPTHKGVYIKDGKKVVIR